MTEDKVPRSVRNTRGTIAQATDRAIVTFT